MTEWGTHKRRIAYQLHKDQRIKMRGVIPDPLYIDKPKKAKRLCEKWLSAKVLAVDTEFDPDTLKISVWSLSDGKKRYALHVDTLPYLKPILENPNIKKVLSYSRVDIKTMRANGVTLRGVFGDTTVLDFLVDSERKLHGLKSVAGDWLGFEMEEFLDLFGMRVGNKRVAMPMVDIMANLKETFIDYASLDAYTTIMSYKHHRKVLMQCKAKPRAPGFDDIKTIWDYYKRVEEPFLHTTNAVVARGIRIDRDQLLGIGRELEKVTRRVEHVYRYCAPPIQVERTKNKAKHMETVKPHDIKLSGHQQMAALFYDTLKLKCPGEPTCQFKPDKDITKPQKCRSTNADHLAAWAPNVLFARLLLEHRAAQKMQGSFVQKLLTESVEESKGVYVVRTNLNQAGTSTGRYSSSDPNLQNIPARKDTHGMRKAFIARPGCALVVADYSMAEIRLLAHESRDSNMISTIKNDVDIHALTAKRCWKLPCAVEEVKKLYPHRRQGAKEINFGLSYGMKAGLLAQRLGITRDEAQALIDAFFDLYPDVYIYIQKMIHHAREHGYVTTLLGRRRYITHINADPGEKYSKKRAGAENGAMNAPIQGGVADIMRLAMTAIENDAELREYESQQILQIHDELINECPEIYKIQVRDRVKYLMENVMKLRVPLVADAHEGNDWFGAKAA